MRRPLFGFVAVFLLASCGFNLGGGDAISRWVELVDNPSPTPPQFRQQVATCMRDAAREQTGDQYDEFLAGVELLLDQDVDPGDVPPMQQLQAQFLWGQLAIGLYAQCHATIVPPNALRDYLEQRERERAAQQPAPPTQVAAEPAAEAPAEETPAPANLSANLIGRWEQDKNACNGPTDSYLLFSPGVFHRYEHNCEIPSGAVTANGIAGSLMCFVEGDQYQENIAITLVGDGELTFEGNTYFRCPQGSENLLP